MTLAGASGRVWLTADVSPPAILPGNLRQIWMAVRKSSWRWKNAWVIDPAE
jgi:hypothetical protein